MSPRAVPRALLVLAALALPAPAAANPLLPGDHPDPSVARVGGAFYATSTAGDWAPLFPVFRSTDLVNWTQVGSILRTPPPWASGRFWAPEIRSDHGHVTAFYSASRPRGRGACIGVATAPRPEGPWRDRGKAVCPPGGAIDAAPVTDTDGSRWLAWKKRGSGGGIYLQRLNRTGLRATGEPVRLIVPDAHWERGVTEGPTFVHHGGWWYLLYSGGNCCRPPCTYAEGVARAPALQGPYVKDPANPVLRGNATWKCPGHGTAIDLGARGAWLVHHAYRRSDRRDLRRLMLLDPIAFGADGWPEIGDDDSPATIARSPFGDPAAPLPDGFTDGFAGRRLAPGWEWPFYQAPQALVAGSTLTIGCHWRNRFVARQVPAGALLATASVRAGGRASAGLAVYGDGGLRGVELSSRGARQFAAAGDVGARVGRAVREPAGRRLVLGLSVDAGGRLSATVGAPGAAPAPVPAGPATGGSAPTRVALTCRGRGTATFEYVRASASAGAQSLR